jgi:hypothetical protein
LRSNSEVSVPITFLNRNNDYNIEGFAQMDSNTTTDNDIVFDTIEDGEITGVDESYCDYENHFAGKVTYSALLTL